MVAETDPVIAKRNQVKSLVKLGKVAGYSSYGVATVLLLYSQLVSSSSTIEWTIVALIIFGSVVLAPAIVFGYAAKAADRADREQSW